MSNAEGKAKSTMQYTKKNVPVRYKRPRAATGLSSGRTKPQVQAQQPFEFRLAALSDGPLNQLRLFVTANLPDEPDFLWLPTTITVFSWEAEPTGIVALRNVDAWCAEQHLRARLFVLFGDAISTGMPITRTLLTQIISLKGTLRNCQSKMPAWVADIKQDQAAGRISLEQASARLWQLHALIDSLESKLILPQA